MMHSSGAKNVNINYQLVQREMGIGVQSSPKAFQSNLFRDRYRMARNLYKYDLVGHYGCVNAIEFSKGGQYLASGGDDKRVLIWNLENALADIGEPRALATEHSSNIFCLGFDIKNRRVLSGGNDDLVISHDFETGQLFKLFKHENPVYGLSVDPNCENLFATACEDGQILLFDQRIDPDEPIIIADSTTSYHAVEFNPLDGNYLITANSKSGAAYYDIRKPMIPVIQYGEVNSPSSCMSVRFNAKGDSILALRRRLPPVLYNTKSPSPVCTFFHCNYYNSCTMKSCTFAGEDDEFVLSGSDDFNLYVWRICDVDIDVTNQWIESTQMVLYGHRSIVNQVRYNRQKCLLASSGVEKIVKLWSPFNQKGWTGSYLKPSVCSENPRRLFAQMNYPSFATAAHNWGQMTHDYSGRNTNEDPRMMAFFDSLIQQEIEGWVTSSESTSSSDSSSNIDSHSTEFNNNHDDDDDDDDDDDNIDRLTRVRRRPKCVVLQRNGNRRSDLLTKPLNSPRKYPNRIAYLIATKRNTLRRLAIKGASLNSRPIHKVKNGDYRNHNGPSTSASTSQIARYMINKRSAANRLNSMRGNSSSGMSSSGGSTPIASTSAATTEQSVPSYRPGRRTKYQRTRAYETSSDDTESDSPAIRTSNRLNSVLLANNAAIPSTSTGITSSLKGTIRLDHKYVDSSSNSDSDSDSDADTRSNNMLSSLKLKRLSSTATLHPTKKRFINNICTNKTTENNNIGKPASSSSSSCSMKNSKTTQTLTNLIKNGNTNRVTARPIISAALKINPEMRLSSIGSTSTAKKTKLPQKRNSNKNAIVKVYATRNRLRSELAEFSNSSHSNSRLSNSSNQDDSSTSSSSTTVDVPVIKKQLYIKKINNSQLKKTTNTKPQPKKQQQPQQPQQQQQQQQQQKQQLKRHNNRQQTAASKRRKFSGDNQTLETLTEGEDVDSVADNGIAHHNNNNNTNNNNNNSIYGVDEQQRANNNASLNNGDDELSITNNYNERTPLRKRNSSLRSECDDNVATTSSNAKANNFKNLYCTPDSGISMPSVSNTPNGNCHSDDSTSNNNNNISINIVAANTQHFRSGNIIAENSAATSSTSSSHHTSASNADVINNNNANSNTNAYRLRQSATAYNIFKQKVARLRRNYRKKFVDESDSD